MSNQNSISNFLNELDGTEGAVDKVVSEGISNLRSKISEVEVEVQVEEVKPEKKEAAPVGTGLADRAIDTYKTKIKPPTEAGIDNVNGVVTDQPSTKASREMMKATIRALTNRCECGNEGKPSIVGPNGSGNVGSGSRNIALEEVEVVEEEKVETLEEYKARVMESFKIAEGAKDQSDKQLDKGMKTTQKAGHILDNSLDMDSDKADRMNDRIRARRKDIQGERINRATKKLAALTKEDLDLVEASPSVLKAGQEQYKKEKEEGRYGGTKPSNERVAKLMKR